MEIAEDAKVTRVERPKSGRDQEEMNTGQVEEGNGKWRWSQDQNKKASGGHGVNRGKSQVRLMLCTDGQTCFYAVK